MAWLVRDGKVLATIEVAESLRDRTRGLLGRDGIEGAILLRPARSVHTFRMRFPIDVAFCDGELRVVKIVTMPRHRMSRPVWRARSVIECEAGQLRRWGISPGDHLEIRGLDAAAERAPGPADPTPGPAGPSASTEDRSRPA